MSIINKVQLAQEKLSSIFLMLKGYGVRVSEQENLKNLKSNLYDYFEQTEKKEYKVIDYALADGNQYINTGIKMKNNISVELKFKLESWSNNESLGGFKTNLYDFNILRNRNGNFESSTGLENIYTIGTINDNIHTLLYNTSGSRLLFDDALKTLISNIEAEDLNEDLLIFANSALGVKPTGRLYSCKIYNNRNGDILRYFVPIIDDNDTVCFFDIVTQEFYYSQGEADFY